MPLYTRFSEHTYTHLQYLYSSAHSDLKQNLCSTITTTVLLLLVISLFRCLWVYELLTVLDRGGSELPSVVLEIKLVSRIEFSVSPGSAQLGLWLLQGTWDSGRVPSPSYGHTDPYQTWVFYGAWHVTQSSLVLNERPSIAGARPESQEKSVNCAFRYTVYLSHVGFLYLYIYIYIERVHTTQINVISNFKMVLEWSVRHEGPESESVYYLKYG